MRIMLASLLIIINLPAIAQSQVRDVPAAFVSPTLTEGWETQPQTPSNEQALAAALQLGSTAASSRGFVHDGASADELLERAKRFGSGDLGIAAHHSGSTVGQGSSD
jgi:hypothetical protein